MSIRLMNLRSVPDDEAEEIRQLLTEQGFDFYETPGGRWGISSPGLWLRDKSSLGDAKTVLEHYQAERYQRARAEYGELKKTGMQRTWVNMIVESPGQVIFYIAVIGLILYFSIVPFLRFGA
ncbi:hypothetical protein JYU13_00820 [Gammaproteobacteria bacterium AH-315-M22]|nr:hypothetical protein [Gammaproteobacteria bacterium AH-315-M22]